MSENSGQVFGFSARFPAERVLSVIVPVRNHARPLKKLLAKLKAQIPPPGWTVEIIAVDNRSTDSTAGVIRQSGVRYVRCETLGASAARNAGAAAARGDILYFIDADACPVHDDHFSRLIGLAAQAGYFGAFGGPIVLPRGQRWNPIAIGDHWACWFNWHPKRRPQRTKLFQPGVSFVVSRAAYQALGGCDEKVTVLEDMELQHRLIGHGLPILFSPDLPVTHEARGSLLRSWRHSWSWGEPFRTRYLAGVTDYPLKYPVGDRRFWRNLPALYRRRMGLVSRATWKNSKWQACYAYPFLAATVLVWTMGVVWGSERQSKPPQSPI